MLIIASFITFTSFAQKAKANQYNFAATTIKTGIADISLKDQMKNNVTKAYSNFVQSIATTKARKCPQCGEQIAVNRIGSKQASKVYTCTMHPNMACGKEGPCPICSKG